VGLAEILQNEFIGQAHGSTDLAQHALDKRGVLYRWARRRERRHLIAGIEREYGAALKLYSVFTLRSQIAGGITTHHSGASRGVERRLDDAGDNRIDDGRLKLGALVAVQHAE